jgi:signal transduction histidine kinase
MPMPSRRERSESGRLPEQGYGSLPTLAFALALLVLILGGLLGVISAERLIINYRQVGYTDDAMMDVATLFATLSNAVTSQRGYLLTGDDAYLRPYGSATKRLPGELSLLEVHVTGRQQQARLAALEHSIDLQLGDLALAIAREKAGDHATAVGIMLTNRSEARMDSIRAQVAAIQTAERALLAQRGAQSERSSHAALVTIIVPALIGAALLGLVFYLSRRNLQLERSAAEALRKADRHKDEFLAFLAHELRAPLAPLRNAVAVLKRAGTDEGIRQQMHEMMERQLGQLARLVADLVDVSRIARGQIDLRREPVDLARIAQQAIETCRPLIDSARHALEVSVTREPLCVDADPARLTQVMSNLLHNACKYTEPGGRIELALTRDPGEAVIRVRDTGIGIPTDEIHDIFDLFVQVDGSAERSQGGLGVGLAVVKRLVRMHGGTVSAASEGPGRGSEFVVRLPLDAGRHPHEDDLSTLPPLRGAVTTTGHSDA